MSDNTTYSLNEIDAQCKKAARGAGLAWGYAEEIGKACRWFAFHKLNAIDYIVSYLQDYEIKKSTPAVQTDYIDPIHHGAWLQDQLQIKPNKTIQLQRLNHPLLLLPYLANIAAYHGLWVKFTFAQSRYLTNQKKLVWQSPQPAAIYQTETACYQFYPDSINEQTATNHTITVNKQQWDNLNQFATKTYVPASAISRLGAGP